MNPSDLIKTAEILVSSSKRRPAVVSLRRAVSSCYYALFHCLARDCANLFIGGDSSSRSDEAWHQVYRALEHGTAKDRCKNSAMIKKFPSEIEDFANTFVTLQNKRHDADYDPSASFSKSSVISDIILVERTIKKFKAAKISDRRAFCAYVLLKKRAS